MGDGKWAIFYKMFLNFMLTSRPVWRWVSKKVENSHPRTQLPLAILYRDTFESLLKDSNELQISNHNESMPP
jgi:hypothetical protein